MTMPPSVTPFVQVPPMANQAVFLDQWNTVGRISCNFQSTGWKRCCSFLLLLSGNSALTGSLVWKLVVREGFPGEENPEPGIPWSSEGKLCHLPRPQWPLRTQSQPGCLCTCSSNQGILLGATNHSEWFERSREWCFKWSQSPTFPQV